MNPSEEVEGMEESVEGETDLEWTIIDPKMEFESAVASLKSMVSYHKRTLYLK